MNRNIILPTSSNEGVDEVMRIWEKTSRSFLKKIKEYLIKEKIITKDEKIHLEGDFNAKEIWQAETLLRKSYSFYGIKDIEENLTSIIGRLFLFKNSIRLSPSFGFSFKKEPFHLSINQGLIKDLLAEARKAEEGSIAKVYTEDWENGLNIFNGEKEERFQKLCNEVSPALSQLGFSGDEAKLMTLAATKHSRFKETMSLEDIVGLALQSRGA